MAQHVFALHSMAIACTALPCPAPHGCGLHSRSELSCIMSTCRAADPPSHIIEEVTDSKVQSATGNG